MAEVIRQLNPNVAAELRSALEDVDSEVAWTVTRLCEQAQATGYHDGYVRGMADGHERSRQQVKERERKAAARAGE
jgi:hypothetical protein